MRNGVAFASAIVTTFILVVLAGVVYAYRVQAASAPAPQSESGQQPVADQSRPRALVIQQVSPQAAASLAAKFLNRTDLYSVELTSYNGIQAYKVAFTAGDIVYLDLTGTVLGVVPAPQAPVASARRASSGEREHGGRSDGGSGGAEREDGGGAEHEDGAG